MTIFVLLMLDDDIWQTFSEEEQGQWIQKYREFAKSFDDRIVKADPINSVGRYLSVENGEIQEEVVDFAGDPDHITGYFIYQAEGWDEAVEIAKRCPTLEYGGRIELRKVGH
ncbi:MAG: hypothetical protein JST12_08400 [Armatimonadetes bacterium]|nr:hypothetical protein [Armatimonadota bacterium]MBS1701667.1 hypothetical protein [Armatimonadota bacterium]MBS1727268.1 hypothetical protein [Armatimonadota bacterium]